MALRIKYAFSHSSRIPQKALVLWCILLSFFCHKIAFCQESIQNPKVSNIGLNLGTFGAQLDYEIPFKNEEEIAFKTGLFFLQFRQALAINMAENSSININPDLQTFGLSFKAEKPVQNWLKIYVESRVFLNQKWKLNLSIDNQIDFNGLTLEADDFGTINASLKWWNIQPGIGIILGKKRPEKTWSMAASIATYYMGSPKLGLSYEGFLETTTLQDAVPKIEHNMKNYSFYPAIGISINYRLDHNQE